MSEETQIKLLDDISKVIAARNFNILDVMGVGEKEVYMCRVLAELLKPNGKHKQGDRFIKLFFKKVLEASENLTDYKGIKVHDEHPTDENRRIDIVLEGSDFIIPIEVKINAGDQENQCEDYIKFAEAYAARYGKSFSKFYYLTKHGTMPSGYNASKTDKIKTISWNGIYEWLEGVQVDNDPSFITVLKQYADTIKKFLGKENDIMKVITKSPESVEAAIAIVENMHELKLTAINRMSERLGSTKSLVEQPLKEKNNNGYEDESNKLYRTYKSSDKHYFRFGYIENVNCIHTCFIPVDNEGKSSGKFTNYESICEMDEFHKIFDDEELGSFISKIVDNYNKGK